MARERLDPSERHRLPTRVLDLGLPEDGSDPRLIETAGYPAGQWAALSHCWGSLQHHPVKTTRTSLKQHIAGIPLSSLPKTFIDAILVTKELGIRFVSSRMTRRTGRLRLRSWDSSTTAQSSPSRPRQHQTRLMVCLKRPYSSYTIPSVSLPFIQKDPTSGEKRILGNFSVGLELRQEPFERPMNPMASLLGTRGWVTQEWVLSRRVVHFLDRGMV